MLTGIAALAPATYFHFFPLIAVGAILAIIGFVLALRSRLRGTRGPLITLPLVVAPIVAIVNVVVFVVLLTMIIGPAVNHVRVEAQSLNGFTAEFVSGAGPETKEWPLDDEWWAEWNTEGSTVELTITPMPGDRDYGAVCRIFWNERQVAAEVSNSGPVSCSYPTP